MRKLLCSTFLAGAFVLAAGAASAQDYGYGPPPGEEDITVYAPRVHVEPSKPLDGVPEKLSMSVNVRYDDLDLRSREGARELRGAGARFRPRCVPAAPRCLSLPEDARHELLQGRL